MALPNTATGTSIWSYPSEVYATQIQPLTCQIYGKWHKYEPHVIDRASVILTCECGDVKWVDRPKQEAK